jgi:hypothetical protein
MPKKLICMIPRYIALGLSVPPTLELFHLLVEDPWCVFVQDIYSPYALANGPAWDAAVRRIHGRFASIRAIARRDAGTLNLTTPAHRQIVSDSNNRRVADGTHHLLHENGYVNPSLDFPAWDSRLQALIDFKDGEFDAQPKRRTKYTFDFGECDLNTWKDSQRRNQTGRVHPGWIPRIAALQEVLALKPDNRCKLRPIWNASTYAHITRRIRNNYQVD